ncbi:MAG TPA: deoxyribodipyrimidine photo-lyase [Rhizomicrobium sp.]|jgi:deoxyribodipyrimidine photo-lyase
MVALLWFRQDLRLADNPAFSAAVACGLPLVPVYVLEDEDAGAWAPGGAARWWLHGSLTSLAKSLDHCGSQLVLRKGKAEDMIPALVAETGATSVFWNRRYEPWATARDARIKDALRKSGVEAQSFNASLLCEPWALKTQQGGPYRVFTPFWKALRARTHEPPSRAVPKHLKKPGSFPRSDALESWSLRPKSPDWAGGLRSLWHPGEAGAAARLRAFTGKHLGAYRDARNLPSVDGTSRLSPHLHFGEIGPRQIWHAVQLRAESSGDPVQSGAETYLSEIAWREFSYHLLYHFPHMPETPLREAFAGFPWANDAKKLRAWQRGQTGYPIVDAGMRELWTTGWMHNRVRMVVASFLTKHLRIDWREGEKWFWDTLVDADLANNSASWQWVAGCGADAAPYFRIFNPTLQGEKFDADGDYIRHWVPELAGLPAKLLHAPWTGSTVELALAGVVLGKTYPHPIVDHASARAKALSAYRELKSDD